jgi:hypothetical protein
VGFFFGERLHKELDVPIGLIASSWGGSEIRSWMPPESFSMFEYTEKEAAQVALDASKSPQASPQLKAIDPKGKKLSTMFNGMIAPLIPYAMRGVIWYQGESNGATFFITEGLNSRKDKKAFLTGDEVRKLNEAGFEIGNHTRSHPQPPEPRATL